jgi:dextranase
MRPGRAACWLIILAAVLPAAGIPAAGAGRPSLGTARPTAGRAAKASFTATTTTQPSTTSAASLYLSNWKDMMAIWMDDNDSWSNNTKSTVIAAYLDQAYSQNYSDTSPSFFSDPGVLLADAAIFASGGDHIEFGDIDHLLDQPDYTNEHLLMDSSLMTQLRHYYDFLVAYENLLRDGETPSSNQIMLSGEPESSTGTAGTIWDFASSKSGTDVLNFINLLNNSSSDWMDTNASYPAPTEQSNVQVKYYYTSSTAPASVQVASPDVNGGAAQNLPFTTGSDSGGNYVTFTLPSLDYWDLAWVTY